MGCIFPGAVSCDLSLTFHRFPPTSSPYSLSPAAPMLSPRPLAVAVIMSSAFPGWYTDAQPRHHTASFITTLSWGITKIDLPKPKNPVTFSLSMSTIHVVVVRHARHLLEKPARRQIIHMLQTSHLGGCDIAYNTFTLLPCSR